MLGSHSAVSRRVRYTIPVVLLALLAAACGGGRGDDSGAKGSNTTAPGGTGEAMIDTSGCATDPSTVTPAGDTIKVGTSLPQSDLYSAFDNIRKGEAAYFKYVNDQGGAEFGGKKYRLRLIAKDDKYLAERTVSNVNSLIRDDKVFALLGVVGTKNNLAVRQTIESQCIPNVFVSTGAPQFGNPDYKWTIGTLLVPYPDEMKALADYLKENKPDATVAILRASDDFGQAYTESFQDLIKGTDIKVVKTATYNAEEFDTKSQVASLAASRADVFILGATLLACPDALKNVGTSNWRPMIYMSGTCTSGTLMEIAENNLGGAAADVLGKVISVAPLLDPVDPANGDNDNMKAFKENVSAEEANNSIVAFGWSQAALFVETLRRAKSGDRLGLMEAARNLDGVSGIGLQLPGQTWNTGPDDDFVGETFHLVEYDIGGKFFKALGDLIDLDGKTADFTPSSLLNS